jgi:hypothetical protein
MAVVGIDSHLSNRLMTHENAMVNAGGKVLTESGRPCEYDGRRCQDVFWGLAFTLVAGGVCVLAGMGVSELDQLDELGKQLADSIKPVALASVVSALAALVFLQLTQMFPEAMVWTALLLTPIMLVVGGAAICVLLPEALLIGAGMALLGLMLGACIICCYRSAVPFTVMVLEMVVHITKMHAGMMLVSIFGSMLSCVWVLAVCFAAIGAFVQLKPGGRGTSTGNEDMEEYAFLFIFVLICSWGSYVCVNICHVACSGVFGKWYFGKDQIGSPVGSSLKMALTTSFGSICLGSFLVAFVRAMEAVARSIKERAREEGNIVLCIVAAILECVVRCIGDMLEWFNSFAYVQCALRGVGFCDAARATYALCTVANVRGIVATCLVGWVAGLGCLFCALLGTCATLPFYNPVATGLGFITAVVVGGGALQVIDSGATTIMVCWAENDGMLRQNRPELHDAFADRSGRDQAQAREIEMRH